jgi:hypothetical protein
MEIVWQRIDDIYDYVTDTLSQEAPDIPEHLVDQAPWYVETIDLDKIKVDQEMVDCHDIQAIHIKRRDDFVLSCKSRRPILPLIVLGKDKFLVDGYARYRALRMLNVAQVSVIRQRFD